MRLIHAGRLAPLSFAPLLLLALLCPAQSPSPSAPPLPTSPATPPEATMQHAPDPASDALAQQSEEELRRRLQGKWFYLRDGYLSDALSFDAHGALSSSSPQGSHTLSLLQIERIRLTKRRLELFGNRYGLHFLGQLAYEASAPDRVLLNPKKRPVHIAIDRESVVKVKPVKPAKTAPKNPTESAPQPEPAPVRAPEVATPAHAAQLLDQALDRILAPELDERMMARLPDFWRLYYHSVAARQDYRPQDPAVLRQNQVDQKARLLSNFEPPSNDYAQGAGVAGMSLYHVVIAPDGKAGEIAVARPIGFGLDENAVEAIRKASFAPALKDGHPVPVLLDLVVQFRIYSQRTAVTPHSESAVKAEVSVRPGPYTLEHLGKPASDAP